MFPFRSVDSSNKCQAKSFRVGQAGFAFALMQPLCGPMRSHGGAASADGGLGSNGSKKFGSTARICQPRLATALLKECCSAKALGFSCLYTALHPSLKVSNLSP